MAESSRCRFCLALTVAWLVAVGVLSYLTWPHLPLDLSPNDPATVAAYQAAVTKHLATYAGIGLGVPLLVYLASRLFQGRP